LNELVIGQNPTRQPISTLKEETEIGWAARPSKRPRCQRSRGMRVIGNPHFSLFSTDSIGSSCDSIFDSWSTLLGDGRKHGQAQSALPERSSHLHERQRKEPVVVAENADSRNS
jgi:hypothetical protein